MAGPGSNGNEPLVGAGSSGCTRAVRVRLYVLYFLHDASAGRNDNLERMVADTTHCQPCPGSDGCRRGSRLECYAWKVAFGAIKSWGYNRSVGVFVSNADCLPSATTPIRQS